MKSLELQPWFCLPFALTLLSVAILPTFWPRFWNKFHFFILALFAVPALLLTFAINPSWILHTFVEYASFICLLGALYKIGGGLYVSGAPKANPIANVIYMIAGAIIANLIGTLGASMLLIRPLLRSNRGRKNEAHVVVFFIFIVSNCGGLLTPLGDPPLLMGYLSGVPFWWTMKLFPIWLFVMTSLLGIFAALDSYFFLKDPDFRGPMKMEVKEPLKIAGKWNILLAGVTGLALVAPQILPIEYENWRIALRLFLLIAVVQLSDKLTPHQVKISNKFSWAPFNEVAVVFAGIFSTMILTVKYLEVAAPSFSFGKSPINFYWLTGFASSLLDNAPSYAAMFAMSLGLEKSYPLVNVANGGTINENLLMAISCASVLFGALTYIGNGPNLLVQSLAKNEGVKTPSFFGFIGWGIVFLLPVLFLTGLLFFI